MSVDYKKLKSDMERTGKYGYKVLEPGDSIKVIMKESSGGLMFSAIFVMFDETYGTITVVHDNDDIRIVPIKNIASIIVSSSSGILGGGEPSED